MEKLGGVAKRVGTRSDNLRADYFCFIPFSILLKAGKCINAASHNGDYTRVKQIKRAILLLIILQTHCPGSLIPLDLWRGMLCELISTGWPRAMRLLGRCRPQPAIEKFRKPPFRLAIAATQKPCRCRIDQATANLISIKLRHKVT